MPKWWQGCELKTKFFFFFISPKWWLPSSVLSVYFMLIVLILCCRHAGEAETDVAKTRTCWEDTHPDLAGPRCFSPALPQDQCAPHHRWTGNIHVSSDLLVRCSIVYFVKFLWLYFSYTFSLLAYKISVRFVS